MMTTVPFIVSHWQMLQLSPYGPVNKLEDRSSVLDGG
jgi:hypothetical protein